MAALAVPAVPAASPAVNTVDAAAGIVAALRRAGKAVGLAANYVPSAVVVVDRDEYENWGAMGALTSSNK